MLPGVLERFYGTARGIPFVITQVGSFALSVGPTLEGFVDVGPCGKQTMSRPETSNVFQSLVEHDRTQAAFCPSRASCDSLEFCLVTKGAHDMQFVDGKC